MRECSLPSRHKIMQFTDLNKVFADELQMVPLMAGGRFEHQHAQALAVSKDLPFCFLSKEARKIRCQIRFGPLSWRLQKQ